ncbi:DNA helicase [Arthrobacter phage Atuin]|nr:DNA helicase [Arthrobacter phage Atuin]
MTLHAEIDSDDNTKIIITEYEWRYKELIDSIPSATFKPKLGSGPNAAWHLSLTWQTCLALKSTFKDKLIIGPKLAQWTHELYTNVVLPAYNMRDNLTAEGYDGLYPHQKGDVAFLSLIKRGFLFNGMGSGKSISSFSAIKRLHELGELVFPVLIACPNSTKYSWEEEVEKVMPGLTISVVDGTASQRKKIFEKPAHVYIINWESLRMHSRLKGYGSTALKRCTSCKGLDPKVKPASCEAHNKELNDIPFRSVIGDEIHRIKDPHSKAARAFKAATGDAEVRIGLSGTPIASNPSDLFSALNWMWPEAYPNRKKWIERMFIQAESGFGGKVVVGIRPEMETEFFQCIDPFTRRMPKEIILPFLPPIVPIRRDVEMGAKQAKAYKQMKEQMLAEVDDDIIYTTSPLVKATRLLQFSSAYAEVEYKDIYDPKLDMVVNKQYVKLSDPSCKLDAFMDDLEDFGDNSVVVFAVSSQLINMLSARLDKLKIPHGLITGDQDAKERKIHMDNFQAGNTKYILCTIAAAGTGITLTKGNTAVFLQRSWSMIENLQAEARVHRIGSEQHESIQIIDYVVKDSSEESVFKAVALKEENLEAILRDKVMMRKFINGELDLKPEEKKEEE